MTERTWRWWCCGGYAGSIVHGPTTVKADLVREVAQVVAAETKGRIVDAMQFVLAYVTDAAVYTKMKPLPPASLSALKNLLRTEAFAAEDDSGDFLPSRKARCARLVFTEFVNMSTEWSTTPMRPDAAIRFFILRRPGANPAMPIFVRFESADDARDAGGFWGGANTAWFSDALFEARLAETLVYLNQTRFISKQHRAVLTPAILWAMHASDDPSVLENIARILLSWEQERGHGAPARTDPKLAARASQPRMWAHIIHWLSMLPPRNMESVHTAIRILFNLLRAEPDGAVTFERRSDLVAAAPDGGAAGAVQYPKTGADARAFIDSVLQSPIYPSEMDDVLRALEYFGPAERKYDVGDQSWSFTAAAAPVSKRVRRTTTNIARFRDNERPPPIDRMRCTKVRVRGQVIDVMPIIESTILFAEMATHVGETAAASALQRMWKEKESENAPALEPATIPIITVADGTYIPWARVHPIYPSSSSFADNLLVPPVCVVPLYDECVCSEERRGREGIFRGPTDPTSDDLRDRLQEVWSSGMSTRDEMAHHARVAQNKGKVMNHRRK